MSCDSTGLEISTYTLPPSPGQNLEYELSDAPLKSRTVSSHIHVAADVRVARATDYATFSGRTADTERGRGKGTNSRQPTVE